MKERFTVVIILVCVLLVPIYFSIDTLYPENNYHDSDIIKFAVNYCYGETSLEDVPSPYTAYDAYDDGHFLRIEGNGENIVFNLKTSAIELWEGEKQDAKNRINSVIILTVIFSILVAYTFVGTCYLTKKILLRKTKAAF